MAEIHATRFDQLEAQAVAFHREHPEVWRHFCEFTFELIERGFRHYSAQHGIFARIRWEVDMVTPAGSATFKINNNYSAWYARWFMEAYPQFNGFFHVREQTSQHVAASERETRRPRDQRGGTRSHWRPRRPMPVPERARRRWERREGRAA